MFSHPLKILCLFSLTLCGCVSAGNMERGHISSKNEETNYIIKDLQTFAQDATFYLSGRCASVSPISSAVQKELDEKFNKIFFSPWQQTKPLSDKNDIVQNFKEFRNHLGFGENKRKHTPQWLDHLLAQADLHNYPNAKRLAITIKNTNLRVLPTHKPHFNDFNLAGEGYPFDNLQISLIFANTPLFIEHFTADKAWGFAKSPLASGWIASTDIATVDSRFVNQWMLGKYVALIKDNVALIDEEGIFRFNGDIGAIFPQIGEDDENYKIFIAVADIYGKAVIKQVPLSKKVAVSKPLEFSPLNTAKVINELLNKPYGWGGLYENRDCSALIKDLFTPFGLWLPRNSAAQIRSGYFISLDGFMPREKERVIIEKGIPFLTLLRKEGHVMLYIGKIGNKAVIFHTLWGIKTKDSSGSEGRQVIGQSAITSLQPGVELNNLDTDKGNLLQEINGMSILFPETLRQQTCY